MFVLLLYIIFELFYQHVMFKRLMLFSAYGRVVRSKVLYENNAAASVLRFVLDKLWRFKRDLCHLLCFLINSVFDNFIHVCWQKVLAWNGL